MKRRVFVSYSHDDRAWRDAFREMLGPTLERFGIELWADDHIRSGDDWERVIDEAVREGVLALLLITPAHLNSRFIWAREVPALLDAPMRVVWALVEECLWEDKTLLTRTQGLQDPTRDGALADYPGQSQKRELARLCRKLRDEHLAGLPAMSPRLHHSGGAVAASTRAATLLRKGAGRVLVPRQATFARIEIARSSSWSVCRLRQAM